MTHKAFLLLCTRPHTLSRDARLWPEPSPGFQFALQLFAAEDEGRTEAPTEHKKRKAREEGNIPKSDELVGILVFLFSFWTLSALMSYILAQCMELFRLFFDVPERAFELDFDLMRMTAFTTVLKISVPLMLVSVVVAVVANLFQTQFLFTTKKLQLDFGRILRNIGPNFQKMFWSSESLFNLGKTLAKFLFVIALAVFIVYARIQHVLSMPRMHMLGAIRHLTWMLFVYVNIAGLALLVIAFIDYFFQRVRYIESLKMTKQELKDEFRELEGNPEIKQKVRQLEQQLATRRMLTAVPAADVIITNPTHYAVALQFDPNYMTAPVVLAKGVDHMALRIREIAGDHGIVIHENKPLARALYASVNVGDEIPYEFYRIVADILSLVYTTRGRDQTLGANT